MGLLAFGLPLAKTNVSSDEPLTLESVATPEQIAIQLDASGYSQGTDATCRYRLTGGTWVTGHPLFRVQPNYSNTPDIGPVADVFAWTIIDLAPGTEYEVEVTVDTDIYSVTTTTRALPAAAGAVTDTITAGSTNAQIQTALNGLSAGDVLEFEDDNYTISGLTLSASGTEANPIYIRGESRTGVVLDNASNYQTFFDLQNVSNVIVENMTIAGSGVDGQPPYENFTVAFWQEDQYDATNFTVRNITCTGVDRFVELFDNGQGVLVYDNTVTGNNLWETTPFDFLETGSNSRDDSGIKLPGNGNCAFNNTITGFGDTFSYASHSGNDVTGIGDNIHYYRNDIWNACDDPIEVDYGRRNLTFYDNRMTNVAVATSNDPLYGGPFIFARNIVINPLRVSFHKWNDTATGHFIYSNTFVGTVNRGSEGFGADRALWYQPNNGTQEYYGYVNNVHVYRGAGDIIEIENPGHSNIDFCNNAWSPDRGFDWPGDDWGSLALVQANIATTTPIFYGKQRHEDDVICGDTPFDITVTLGADSLTEVTTAYTPRIATSNNAENAGIEIPNITDGFSGAAPDMGALPDGRSVPLYGDRSNAPSWFTALTPLQWNAPLSNWLGESGVLDPLANTTNFGQSGPSSIIITWVGMGMDQARKTQFMLRNGGHEDYYGNEVYAVDWRSENPAWERLINSSSNPGGSEPQGWPESAHTYYEHCGHDGRWFSPITGYGTPQGQGGNDSWEFNPDTASWTFLGNLGISSLTSDAGCDYNDLTDELVMVASDEVRIYDCSDDGFVLDDTASNVGNDTNDLMVAIDTTNRVILIHDMQSDTQDPDAWYSYNLDNISAGRQSLNPTGTEPILNSQVVWHSPTGGFIGWAGGNNLTVMEPTVDGSGRYSALAGRSVSLTGTPPTDQSQRGLFDKANLVRDMGNGDAMFVVVPRYADPDTYVLRIQGAI